MNLLLSSGFFQKIASTHHSLYDVGLVASAVKNGSKNTYKLNTYNNVAFVSGLLNKSRKQLVTSRKSLSRECIKTAENLVKDCFSACVAAFLSFDLLLKSYRKVGSSSKRFLIFNVTN